MDITFKKKRDELEREVMLKSMDLEHGAEDFQPQIEECTWNQKFITISPECVRCNLCAKECPVDAIQPADSIKPAKIMDNCVKCEICAQTCPVRAVQVIEGDSEVEEDVIYHMHDLKVPHRKLRMLDISVDKDKCESCATCSTFCPTQAIIVEDDRTAVIDKDACIGCGACVQVCPEQAISLSRELGPVIKTKQLLVDQDACVQCQVCEENCPVEAIKLDEDKIVLDESKCILCQVCSTKCPVGALKLESLSHES